MTILVAMIGLAWSLSPAAMLAIEGIADWTGKEGQGSLTSTPLRFEVVDHLGHRSTRLDGDTVKLALRDSDEPLRGRTVAIIRGGVASFDSLYTVHPEFARVHPLLASVRGLDTLKLEPIPTANALAVQSIFVNDHRVDGVPPTVTIAPGDSLRGTAYLRYSTDSPAVLFTLAQTATWNVASQDTLTVRTLNAGVRDARDAVSFAVRGPAKPGAYWLLWTQSAEPAAVWLLSGTNWSCHTPVWDDGNDLATQPDTAVAAGVRSGEIWIKFIYCTPTSRSAAMRQLLIAGMRVVVRPK
jgi:hypothetical protein